MNRLGHRCIKASGGNCCCEVCIKGCFQETRHGRDAALKSLDIVYIMVCAHNWFVEGAHLFRRHEPIDLFHPPKPRMTIIIERPEKCRCMREMRFRKEAYFMIEIDGN